MKRRTENVTVVLSHRRADCQREYCRTVIGLFEEARARTAGLADLPGGWGKKHYLAPIRNVRLTIPEATRDPPCRTFFSLRSVDVDQVSRSRNERNHGENVSFALSGGCEDGCLS
jgi:hypothetical protein